MLALYGCVGGQRGPLWWASNHRRHHRHCETKLDVHSPSVGWFYSHMGWVVNRDNFDVRLQLVRDWLNMWPELLLFDLFFLQIRTTVMTFLSLRLQHFLVNGGGWESLPPGFVT